MKKALEVKFGSMYTTSGKLQMIDDIGLILNKDAGFSKYGSLNGERNIRDYYNNKVKEYRESGLSDIADNLVLIEFDRYDGVLSIEEICTLCNYIIGSCLDYETIMKVLTLGEAEIHTKIAELSNFGY